MFICQSHGSSGMGPGQFLVWLAQRTHISTGCWSMKQNVVLMCWAHLASWQCTCAHGFGVVQDWTVHMFIACVHCRYSVSKLYVSLWRRKWTLFYSSMVCTSTIDILLCFVTLWRRKAIWWPLHATGSTDKIPVHSWGVHLKKQLMC